MACENTQPWLGQVSIISTKSVVVGRSENKPDTLRSLTLPSWTVLDLLQPHDLETRQFLLGRLHVTAKLESVTRSRLPLAF